MFRFNDLVGGVHPNGDLKPFHVLPSALDIDPQTNHTRNLSLYTPMITAPGLSAFSHAAGRDS